MTDHTVPPIGMRMVKTAAAVLICLLVSMAVDREDMRIYSSIAALLCVQPYAEDTKRMAIQRIVGTAIGSVFGIATLLLEMDLDIQGTLVGYIVIAAVTVPNLWIAVVLKSSNAAALSGIVFLSITVTHVTDASPWIFAWYRASETLVGIAVGIAVNAFQLPRRKRRDMLFVSGLDGLLLTEQGTLTPYSRVSLNRMLDDGMQFTLSTMRTPASVREATRDLRLRLPVIVMDGAALYDMEKKRYLHACVLPRELALRCEAVFRAQGIHCFLNGVLDDNLMIYYGEFHHETERAIFEKLRTSPYRNYVSRSYYKDCPIVYLMGIDLTERMQALYDALGEAGLLEQVKVRFYPAAEYPGYSYLKIYERSASREAMLERLKQDLGMERSVVLTTQEGCGDVVIRGGANQAVTDVQIEETLSRFGAGDFLLLQNETNGLEQLMEKAAGKGIRIAFNPSPIDGKISQLPLEKVEFFLLNEIEGAALGGGNRPEEILEGLKKRYPKAKIVLTLGKEGALYFDGEKTFFQPIFPVKAMDTTAAGDTFTGYFLEAVSRGLPGDVCLKRAAAASAIAVSRKGASPSIPDGAEVDAFLAEQK